MKFKSELIPGKLVKRYKRFFADCEVDGSIVVAHVANTGSMKGLIAAGAPVLLSPSDNPERKLKFSLEAVQAPSGAWVGVNTSHPNAIVAEVLTESVKSGKPFIKHWGGYSDFQKEVKINAESRLDFCLMKADGKKHYIEVKNVTMSEGKTAMFPDSETTRGQKHLNELMKLHADGHTCEILFVVQRTDCENFAAAKDIDPVYAQLLQKAQDQGVIVTALVAEINVGQVQLTSRTLRI